MPEWRMRGQWLKNCSCLRSVCPCDTIGIPAPNGFCEGLIGMHIQEGRFDTTDLSGLSWLFTLHFAGPVYEGNGEWEFYVDERTDEQQRAALTQIVSGQAGGTMFPLLAEVMPHLRGTHYVPIVWEFDLERRRAHVRAGEQVETTSAPLLLMPTEDEQRVTVRLPGGPEFLDAEIGQATLLRSTGNISFDWANTHSSLALTEHTDHGLVG